MGSPYYDDFQEDQDLDLYDIIFQRDFHFNGVCNFQEDKDYKDVLLVKNGIKIQKVKNKNVYIVQDVAGQEEDGSNYIRYLSIMENSLAVLTIRYAHILSYGPHQDVFDFLPQDDGFIQADYQG